MICDPINGKRVVDYYLRKMHEQREAVFTLLEKLPKDVLWWRPGPRDWSIGENLDHTRLVNKTFLVVFKAGWYLELPFAHWRRHRPYQVDIDNVYKRPGFPMNVGWLWPPRYTPCRPAPLGVLKTRLTEVHQEIEAFYVPKSPDLLGHVLLFDPVIGWVNLITGLRVGLYHDELHYDTVRTLLRQAAEVFGRPFPTGEACATSSEEA